MLQHSSNPVCGECYYSAAVQIVRRQSDEGSALLMRRGRSCTSPRQGVDSPPVNGDSLYPASASFYKAMRCTASLRTHRLYSDVLLHGGESARRRCLLLATAGVLGASAAADRYRSPTTFPQLFSYSSSTFSSSSHTYEAEPSRK